MLERFANTNEDGTIDEKYQTEYDYETRDDTAYEENSSFEPFTTTHPMNVFDTPDDEKDAETNTMKDMEEKSDPPFVEKLLEKMETEGTKSVEDFLEGSVYPESGSEIN